MPCSLGDTAFFHQFKKEWECWTEGRVLKRDTSSKLSVLFKNAEV